MVSNVRSNILKYMFGTEVKCLIRFGLNTVKNTKYFLAIVIVSGVATFGFTVAMARSLSVFATMFSAIIVALMWWWIGLYVLQFIVRLFGYISVFIHKQSITEIKNRRRIVEAVKRDFYRVVKRPFVLAAIIILGCSLCIVMQDKEISVVNGSLRMYIFSSVGLGGFIVIYDSIFWYRLAGRKTTSSVFCRVMFSKGAFLSFCYSAVALVVVFILIVWVATPGLLNTLSRLESYFFSEKFIRIAYDEPVSDMTGISKDFPLSEARFKAEKARVIKRENLDAKRHNHKSAFGDLYEYAQPFLDATLQVLTIILVLLVLSKIFTNLAVNVGPKRFNKRIAASLVKSVIIGFGAPLVCQVVFWQTDADPFTMTNLFVIIFSFIIFSAGEALRASD